LRIAILNSWPNLEYSAEREFIARMKLASSNLGWECVEVVTSEDILNSNPDCVIVTHEYSAKLTDKPTIGLIWSPPDFYRHDATRIRTMLGYDGYLAGSDSIRTYLKDLLFSTSKETPISDWNFLPTASVRTFRKPNLEKPSIFYSGVHWDGERHGDLIAGLDEKLPMAFHGDPVKWRKFGKAYKGTIPFDGVSIFDRINEAGVALCLHRDEHLKHDVPSMRIFESAAAGAVIITENARFAKTYFGDSVLYVDQGASVSKKLAQIKTHYEWIKNNPDEALALAEKSNAIFNEQFALENALLKLPEFLVYVKRYGYFEVAPTPIDEPSVEIIVRIGGRSLFYIERCLDSIAAQTHRNLGVILSIYRQVEGLDDLLDKYKSRFVSIKKIQSESTGFRSTALFDGIRAVDAKYFCNQDDDDTLHSNHIRSLVVLLESDERKNVAYSGCIQVQDEPGHYYQQINFSGPLHTEINENRHLVFFDQFDRNRILRFDNFVQSNTWLARKAILKSRDLIDPQLKVAEDMYLYFLFLREGDFLFSWRVTANWHWRSTSKDNSMLNETCWVDCGDRVKLRVSYFGLSPDDTSDPRVIVQNLSCKDILRPFARYAKNYLHTKSSRFPFLSKYIAKKFGIGAIVSDDPLGDRYEASLLEGIAFNRVGYPLFVSKISGISQFEKFGRWTDSAEVSIGFTKPLPDKFKLKLKLAVFPHLKDKPVQIVVGNFRLETTFSNLKHKEFEFQIENDGNAREIKFYLPESISPMELRGNADTRKLGLALVYLKIVDQSAPDSGDPVPQVEE